MTLFSDAPYSWLPPGIENARQCYGGTVSVLAELVRRRRGWQEHDAPPDHHQVCVGLQRDARRNGEQHRDVGAVRLIFVLTIKTCSELYLIYLSSTSLSTQHPFKASELRFSKLFYFHFQLWRRPNLLHLSRDLRTHLGTFHLNF